MTTIGDTFFIAITAKGTLVGIDSKEGIKWRLKREPIATSTSPHFIPSTSGSLFYANNKHLTQSSLSIKAFVNSDHVIDSSTILTSFKNTICLLMNPFTGVIESTLHHSSGFHFKATKNSILLSQTTYSITLHGDMRSTVQYIEYSSSDQIRSIDAEITANLNGRFHYNDGSTVLDLTLDSQLTQLFTVSNIDGKLSLLKTYPLDNNIKKQDVYVGLDRNNHYYAISASVATDYSPCKYGNIDTTCFSKRKVETSSGELILGNFVQKPPFKRPDLLTIGNEKENIFIPNTYTDWSVSNSIIFSIIVNFMCVVLYMFYKASFQKDDNNQSNDLVTPSTPKKRRKKVKKDPLQSADSTEKLLLLSLSDTILGLGSHGTIVYLGEFESRPVAIKRLLPEFHTIASNEIRILQNSDHHNNVIRYFCKEEVNGFLYIALELCRASLQQVLDTNEQFNKISILQQITNGVSHLHDLKICHQDIKPQNILFVDYTRIVLSDFGIGRKLESNQYCFTNSFGTVGWRAAESINNEKSTLKVDLFSMGCVFYYTINKLHPFGDEIDREKNIVNGTSFLQGDAELCNITRRLIHKVPNKRPDCRLVLKHPFFWSNERRLAFLGDVSDRFEIEQKDSPMVKYLEKSSMKVMGIYK